MSDFGNSSIVERSTFHKKKNRFAVEVTQDQLIPDTDKSHKDGQFNSDKQCLASKLKQIKKKIFYE